MIVVCGLPRSGNNVVREHILRCIRARRPYHHEDVVVWHGAEPPPRFLLRPPGTRFVMPVRNPRCRLLSMRAARLNPERWPEMQCRRSVFLAVTRLCAPIKIVSYEAFVSDPEGTGADFITWLGYPWVPVPTEGPTDPSAPHRGPIFDGNAKYDASALRQAT